MYYVGIDPGVSGGISIIDNELRVYRCWPMPSSLERIWQVISAIPQPSYALVEKVGGYIKPRKDQAEQENRQPGHMMFRFGENYGCVLTSLLGRGIPFSQETPQVWQKAVGVPKPKPTWTDAQRKRNLRDHAQTLFKYIVPLQCADSLLLAYRCREIHHVETRLAN
jgi:hypothetical protein